MAYTPELSTEVFLYSSATEEINNLCVVISQLYGCFWMGGLHARVLLENA